MNPPAADSVATSGRSVSEELLESAAFSAIDRHFARLMERLSGTPNPALALAAALTSRSQGQGNVCLNLPALAGSLFPDERGTGESRLELPQLEAWVAALSSSPVVGQPAEFKPLILDASHRLYLQRYWQYESDLAQAILRRAEQPAIDIDEARLAEGLARLFPVDPNATEPDWQRTAAATAVQRKLAVISGGPGTGKTRTVVALLVLLLEQAGERPLRIALAAPTGKAAARLQEALAKWRTVLSCEESIRTRLPEESFTLHRLLGSSPDSAQVRHHAENPLPFDVIVVDEASMVDLAMMAKLFAATAPAARLVLLGDKDQLASVEAGAVLGEICAEAPSANAGFERPALAGCVVELQKNFRFGAENGILALSRAINAGDASRALSLLGPDPTSITPSIASRSPSPIAGVSAMALPSPAQLKAQLRPRLLEGFRDLALAREPHAALQALNRFRVLGAVRRGPFGVEALNHLVEEVLAEAGLLSARQRWYRGRPVLITRNDYNLRLYNGDVGIILPDPATGESRAWFAGPDDIPRSVPTVRLPEHETVFAMTVHKSQGSEFEEMLLILPEHESPLLTRELLYTGVTRASRRVELWFEEPVFRAAVARRVQRASGLREALWGRSRGTL